MRKNYIEPTKKQLERLILDNIMIKKSLTKGDFFDIYESTYKFPSNRKKKTEAVGRINTIFQGLENRKIIEFNHGEYMVI